MPHIDPFNPFLGHEEEDKFELNLPNVGLPPQAQVGTQALPPPGGNDPAAPPMAQPVKSKEELEQRAQGWEGFLTKVSQIQPEVFLSFAAKVLEPRRDGASDLARISEGLLSGFQVSRGLKEREEDRGLEKSKVEATNRLAEATAKLRGVQAEEEPKRTDAQAQGARARELQAFADQTRARNEESLLEVRKRLFGAQADEAQARAAQARAEAKGGGKKGAQQTFVNQTAEDFLALGLTDNDAEARILATMFLNTKKNGPNLTPTEFEAELLLESERTKGELELLNASEETIARVDGLTKRLIDKYQSEYDSFNPLNRLGGRGQEGVRGEVPSMDILLEAKRRSQETGRRIVVTNPETGERWVLDDEDKPVLIGR